MATATGVMTQRPSSGRRRMAREMARLEWAAVVYRRQKDPAANNADAWYRRFLLDEYPAPGFGC